MVEEVPKWKCGGGGGAGRSGELTIGGLSMQINCDHWSWFV